MDFQTAIRLFFSKYATFTGRATRAEFWWVALFIFIVSFILNFFGKFGAYISLLFSLAILIPSLALTVRRLHDINLSGWYLLAYYIIGIALAVWGCFNLFEYFPILKDVANGDDILSDNDAVEIFKGMVWPMLIGLIVGIIAIVLMCRKSGPDNKYGPAPSNE